MIKIEENIYLADMTTLGVGGNAEKLAVVRNKSELIEALDYAKTNNLDFIVIGGGSNVLVSDEGFPGLVIVNKANNFTIEAEQVSAESGMSLAVLSKKTLDSGLLGLEFGSGIPGTVGAAVAGNVGMTLGSIGDVLLEAEIWRDGIIQKFNNDDFRFEYRGSALKGSKSVVLSATFILRSGDTEALKSKIKEDLVRRAASYRGHTAGSYFKNPEGNTAAELIDKSGLKGYRIGGAEVSSDHANVFRNTGGATAKDFYELEKYVISAVKEKFEIVLIPEVVKVGKFKV